MCFYHSNYTYIDDFINNKNSLYRGLLNHVVHAHGSWFLMKGAPLGIEHDWLKLQTP